MNENRTRQQKWQDAHPLEVLAHQYVRSAIRRGLLSREPCEVCGAETVDAHHDDYEQPRKVRWLCRLHHKRHHALQRREGDPGTSS